MEEFIHQNTLELVGELDAAPTFSHKNHDVPFYRFLLAVERLSGQKDLLPVLAPQSVLELCGAMEPGCSYRVLGQLRSFNNKGSTGNRLVISTFAQSICPAEEEGQNRLFLAGAICKPPTLRRTPLGRSISDIMLAVNHRYGRADYLPCIAWDRWRTSSPKKRLAAAFPSSAVSKAAFTPNKPSAAPQNTPPTKFPSCTLRLIRTRISFPSDHCLRARVYSSPRR